MPKFYLRRVVPAGGGSGFFEVVDGQQRLQAILDYYNEDLVLSRKHNPTLGDARYSELPDSIQKAFLEYTLSTEVMQKASPTAKCGHCLND